MTESLEFEWVLRPDSNPSLEHYVLHFHGVAQTWDDDAGDEVLVGRIAGHRVDLALADGRQSSGRADASTPRAPAPAQWQLTRAPTPFLFIKVVVLIPCECGLY